MQEQLTFDALDHALLHALDVDGRAPFTRIGEVLGASTQTVARRYRRLRARAGLRVIGLPEPRLTGRRQWIVRLATAGGTAADVAHSLARRPDTAWVRLTSGGTEISAIVETTAGDDHALLLRDLPRTASVTAVSAHYLLHLYRGGPTAWRGRADSLTDAQVRALTPAAPTGTPVELGPADERMLAVLRRDGRAGYAELGAAAGISAATATRRIAALRGAGALFLDVEIDAGLLGSPTETLLFMSVPPARLDEVGRTLATHRELAVVAATTGRTNLLAAALARDPGELHEYLTTRLALDAITAIESAPVLRTLKSAGPLRP